MSTMRCEENFSYERVVDLLLEMLRENDNTKNKNSDSFYLATLIRGVGNFRLRVDDQDDEVY